MVKTTLFALICIALLALLARLLIAVHGMRDYELSDAVAVVVLAIVSVFFLLSVTFANFLLPIFRLASKFRQERPEDVVFCGVIDPSWKVFDSQAMDTVRSATYAVFVVNGAEMNVYSRRREVLLTLNTARVRFSPAENLGMFGNVTGIALEAGGAPTSVVPLDESSWWFAHRRPGDEVRDLAHLLTSHRGDLRAG